MQKPRNAQSGGRGKSTGTGYRVSKALRAARAREFSLVSKFPLGYRNREDITNLPPGTLVVGSQNVLTNVGDRIRAREGYTLDGQANATLTGIEASYDWRMHNGIQHHLRSYGTVLEYRHVDSSNVVTWNTLISGLSSAAFNFAEFWDDTHELKSQLLMVNGASSITEWSGGVTTVDSTGSGNSISLAGNDPALTGSAASSSNTANSASLVGVGTSARGSIYLAAQPTNGDTITLTLNTTDVVFTFVSVIGATAGNVLIGATVAATLANLKGLIQTPGSTTGTQVALSGGNQTLVGYLTPTFAGTLTNQGSSTFSQLGFYDSSANVTNFKFTSPAGTVYTYTGGAGSQTLQGITPDPTLDVTLVTGALIYQPTVTTLNSAMSGLPSITNDLLSNLDNQIYVASFVNNNVYVSKPGNYKDYSFASPRLPSDGQVMTLDASPVALIPQEEGMYMSAGIDYWYLTTKKLSADNTKEAFYPQRLKTASLTASTGQSATSKIDNSIVFLSNEKIINTLGRVENILVTPQLRNLSDSIKLDLDGYSTTDVAIAYNRYFIYVSFPVNGVVRMYNRTTNYWEAPMLLPIGRFSIIDGVIYGHDYTVPQTYKLFSGFNDNGNPINCIAAFSYENEGTRASKKNMNRYYTEGYISSNTTLYLTLKYDFGGSTSLTTSPIAGTDTKIIFQTFADGSIGKNPIGSNPLGSITDSPSNLPKFRIINTFVRQNFYEYQPYYSSNETDQQWEIISRGGNVQQADDLQTEITE